MTHDVNLLILCSSRSKVTGQGQKDVFSWHNWGTENRLADARSQLNHCTFDIIRSSWKYTVFIVQGQRLNLRVQKDVSSKHFPSMMAAFLQQSPQFGSWLDQNQGSSPRSTQSEGQRPEYWIMTERWKARGERFIMLYCQEDEWKIRFRKITFSPRKDEILRKLAFCVSKGWFSYLMLGRYHFFGLPVIVYSIIWTILYLPQTDMKQAN